MKALYIYIYLKHITNINKYNMLLVSKRTFTESQTAQIKSGLAACQASPRRWDTLWDTPRFVRHVNVCSNSRYIMDKYIDVTTWSHVTFHKSSVWDFKNDCCFFLFKACVVISLTCSTCSSGSCFKVWRDEWSGTPQLSRPLGSDFEHFTQGKKSEIVFETQRLVNSKTQMYATSCLGCISCSYSHTFNQTENWGSFSTPGLVTAMPSKSRATALPSLPSFRRPGHVSFDLKLSEVVKFAKCLPSKHKHVKRISRQSKLQEQYNSFTGWLSYTSTIIFKEPLLGLPKHCESHRHRRWESELPGPRPCDRSVSLGRSAPVAKESKYVCATPLCHYAMLYNIDYRFIDCLDLRVRSKNEIHMSHVSHHSPSDSVEHNELWTSTVLQPTSS